MLKSFMHGAELLFMPGAPGPDAGLTWACAIAVTGEESLSLLP